MISKAYLDTIERVIKDVFKGKEVAVEDITVSGRKVYFLINKVRVVVDKNVIKVIADLSDIKVNVDMALELTLTEKYRKETGYDGKEIEICRIDLDSKEVWEYDASGDAGNTYYFSDMYDLVFISSLLVNLKGWSTSVFYIPYHYCFAFYAKKSVDAFKRYLSGMGIDLTWDDGTLRINGDGNTSYVLIKGSTESKSFRFISKFIQKVPSSDLEFLKGFMSFEELELKIKDFMGSR